MIDLSQELLAARPASTGAGPADIEIANLTFCYRGAGQPVLADITLTINRGEFVLVMGPSGCGKSTLVQTFNGVIPHLLRGKVEGEVRVLGKNTSEVHPAKLAKEVGIVFQDPEVQLFALTVEDELAAVLENMGMPQAEMRRRVEWALGVTGLKGLELRQPAKLSGGQKQRVATAATLTYEPSILILDEPTAYLDNEGTVSLLRTVARLADERKLSIILVEHKIELVIDLADRVIIMDQGRVLLDGTPIEVFGNVEVLRRMGVSLPRAVSIGLALRERGVPLPTMPPTISALAREITALVPSGTLPLPPVEPDRPKEETRKPVVEFQDVRFTYGSGRVEALRGVTTTIYEGEFVAIVGHNGSGKSTFLSHIMGILEPTAGRVLVNGRDTHKSGVADLAQSVGIVFQNPDHQIFNETIFDEIAYGPRNFGVPDDEIKERVTEALALVDLAGMERHDPEQLSMGQRQRLAVASVLAMRPQVLLLDEPTVGQDPEHLRRFMEMIRAWNEMGNTVVMITHDIDFAIEYSSRALIMAQGQIQADGPPEEVFRDFKLLERCSVEPPATVRLMQQLFGPQAPPVKTIEQTADFIARAYRLALGG